jgi:hypothetical protein
MVSAVLAGSVECHSLIPPGILYCLGIYGLLGGFPAQNSPALCSMSPEFLRAASSFTATLPYL